MNILNCKKCNRLLPNKSYITESGCIWCDNQYHCGKHIFNNVTAIILAAGKGTRIKSDSPKVLHKLIDESMLVHIINTVKSIPIKNIIVITGHQADLVEKCLDKDIRVIRQNELLGTGDAVKQTKEYLKDFDGTILVMYGDNPLIKAKTLRKLILKHNKTNVSCTMGTSILDNPFGYGRILRDLRGYYITKIIEEKDCDLVQKTVREVNNGYYCFNSKDLFQAVEKIRPNNNQNEYYLTDVIEILSNDNLKINSIDIPHKESIGVNTKEDLEKVRKLL